MKKTVKPSAARYIVLTNVSGFRLSPGKFDQCGWWLELGYSLNYFDQCCGQEL